MVAIQEVDCRLVGAHRSITLIRIVTQKRLSLSVRAAVSQSGLYRASLGLADKGFLVTHRSQRICMSLMQKEGLVPMTGSGFG